MNVKTSLASSVVVVEAETKKAELISLPINFLLAHDRPNSRSPTMQS